MILLLALPIILTTVILYLALSLFGNIIFIWWGSLVLSLVLNILLLKKNVGKIYLKLDPSLFIFLLIIFVYILAKALVLSPVVLTIKQANFEHLQLTDVGDYYKHIFVTTALTQDGIPPSNPYFPQAKLSYYYGYYLIPAAASRVLGVAQNYSLFAFAMLTSLISLSLALFIIFELFKRFYLRLIVFLLIIFGSGMDVLAINLSKINFFKSFGDLALKQGAESGVQLINTYKAFLFVPQHFFAAALTVVLTYYLLKEKKNFWFLGIGWAFVFFSSFVFPTLIIWILIIFFFNKNLRGLILKSGILSLIILVPYILQVANRQNSFYFYSFSPTEFIPGNLLANLVITFIVTYGLLIISLLCSFLLLDKSAIRKYLMYSLLVLVPVSLTWFIRSPLFNDFSLRSMIPIQLLIPVLFLKVFEISKNTWIKKFILMTCIATIFIGTLGFYFEYEDHWKKRSILHPRDSELLLKLRQTPGKTRLAAVSHDRWVELIPSLSFRKVLSPFLFDSYNYIAGDIANDHAAYENLSVELFIKENSALDFEKLVENQNKNFGQLENFFDKYNADQLIINNQVWYKKDTNPWAAIFIDLGILSKPLTGSFTIFDYQDLKEKLKTKKVEVSPMPKEIEIKNNSFFLPAGIWYITSCKNPNQTKLKLELEDYYLLFNQENSNCAGKLFYLKENENLRVNISSTVKEVKAFPIILSDI